MKSVFPVATHEEFQAVLKFQPDEVVIGHKFLSRFGQLSSEEVIQIAGACRNAGIMPILDWDILMSEDLFPAACKIVEELGRATFDAIRVQDPGAINWLGEQAQPMQLVLETGNHNWQAVEEWLRLGDGNITRVILSSELPKAILHDYLSRLEVETEILALGKILLFYTPRDLLSPHINKKEDLIEAVGTSCETPHKGFYLVENFHGTFMFLPKDLCLLGFTDELARAGLTHQRIDLRFGVAERFPGPLSQAKELWPNKLIKGYYNANRSDSVFPKLKNSRKQRRDDHYLGDVSEVAKGKYLVLSLRNPKLPLTLGDSLRFETPDGKTKYLEVEKLWDSSWKEKEQLNFEQLAITRHVGGVSVKTAVYLEHGLRQ